MSKANRLAALEQLKKIKQRGEKNKFEPESTYEPVFDVVDEKEYENRVRKRQEESDWIVTDALTDSKGYVEDGREVFDDEYVDYEDEQTGKSSKSKKSKNPNISINNKNGKSNIKRFFDNAPVKKATVTTTADDDELMQEAMSNYFPTEKTKPKSTTTTIFQKNVQNFGAKFSGTFEPKNLDDIAAENLASNPFSLLKSNVTTTTNKRPPILSPSKEFSPNKLPPTKQSKVDSSPAKKQLNFTNLKAENNEQDQKYEIMDEFDEEIVPKSAEVDLKMEKNVKTFDKSLNLNLKLDEESSKEIYEPQKSNSRTMKFYLLDVYEDFARNPGTIYLFGRKYDFEQKSYTSCALIIKDIERRLFILPRERRINLKNGEFFGETVETAEVYEEFTQLTQKMNIPKMRCKFVKKKYNVVGSLNVDAPFETDYLEVRYGFNYPNIPSGTVGETFGAVFGSSSSALELFLIERNIKGPRWLEICDFEEHKAAPTWCSCYTVQKMSNISPTNETTAPPIRAAILKLKTMPNKRNQHEVVCASLWSIDSLEFDKNLLQKNWRHCCVVAATPENPFPMDFRSTLQNQSITTVEIVPNERALLNFLLTKMQRLDPDVIFGHDLWNLELETMIQRVFFHKLSTWSRLGRIKRSTPLKTTVGHKSVVYDLVAGRLLCDISVMARELIAKSKDYDLCGLVEEILKIDRPEEIPPENVKFMYNNGPNLLNLIANVKNDAFYILSIADKLKCLPLTAEITRIVGGVWSKTLMGGRSERTEFLLLHALESAGFIFPDKPFFGHNKKKTGKFSNETIPITTTTEEDAVEDTVGVQTSKKTGYTGGLVLEPKKGLYDQMILLLDFNSLYPSIMQEFNICFTTINLLPYKIDPEKDSLPNIPEPNVEMGILPVEIRKLVESRRIVKNLMKDPNLNQEQKQQYTIRQQALKITANSMYGCLGFANSRFFAKPLAALITSKGREILTDTKELVESMGLDVIYGDTDSIMINTNRFDLDEVYTLAKKIKNEVNKKYSTLELDIDGVFRKLLLLKKKKYAGLLMERNAQQKVVYTKQIKGLDIIRRDWSIISIESGEYVLNEILSERGLDEILDNIHQFLSNLGQEIRNGDVPREKYVIKKQLAKAPKDYGDKISQPHVTVALRLNEKGRKFKQGDVISYVICQDGTSNSAVQRAYDLSEMVEENSKLTIDSHYYLGQQIHPVVSRLCEVIDGTDAVRIAECLGLDASTYKNRAVSNANSTNQNEDEYDWSTLFNPNNCDGYCSPFDFQCTNPECNSLNEIDSIFRGKGLSIEFSLWKCKNENCAVKPFDFTFLLTNRLRLLIFKLIGKYYGNWMTCDDITCNYRTRKISFKIDRGQIICPSCKRNILKQEINEKILFDQLTYFQRIFDIDTALSQISGEELATLQPKLKDINDTYNQLHNVVRGFLEWNNYSQVDLGKLFSGFKIM